MMKRFSSYPNLVDHLNESPNLYKMLYVTRAPTPTIKHRRCRRRLPAVLMVMCVVGLLVVESQYNLLNVLVRDSVHYIRNMQPHMKVLHKSPRTAEMVLFTSWGDSGHGKDMVHNSILQLWKSLHPGIKTVLFTSNKNVKQHGARFGWPSHPEYSNPECKGPPLFGRMFIDAIARYNASFYGFANADIAFGRGLVQTLKAFIDNTTLVNSPLLIVGKRTNFDFDKYHKPITTADEVKCLVKMGDEMHWSSDYFITTKSFPWPEVIPLSIGRPLFCRWIIAYALQSNIPVIDASHTIEALHLTTDDGNRSSWYQPGIHCNRDIIQDSFPKVQMLLGRVECTNLETVGDDGVISIRHRNVTQQECPVVYHPNMQSVWYKF